MKKSVLALSVLAGFGMLSANALAADQGLENCIQAVKKRKSG